MTKQTVLKLTAQVYDPLGWTSPVLFEMKLLFQKICQTKEDWDGELSLELKQQYEKWITELENVGSVRIARCYFSMDESLPSSLQLHGFSDGPRTSMQQPCTLELNKGTMYDQC